MQDRAKSRLLPGLPVETDQSGRVFQSRLPLGQAIAWTDEELDALAVVSPQDVAEAQASVRKNATPKGKAMWEATPDEGPP